MNKEVVVAIVIGIVLGLSGALYLNKQKIFGSSKIQPVTSEKVRLVTKPADAAQISYFSLPENSTVVTKGTFALSGKSRGYSLITAANELGIETAEVKKNDFKINLELKPGRNNVVLVAHGKKKEEEKLKVLTVFYLKELPAPRPTAAEGVDEQKKEATTEANILKDRLEQKVMELRRGAKQAISGTVNSISDKEVVVAVAKNTVKISLEPEVTRFYDIEGEGMTDIEAGEIEKGDTITAFISEIAGEEKSYTVYREPSTLVLYGKVSDVDTDNYVVSIINYDKTTYEIDVEVGSVQQVYNIADNTIEKYGFSKLEIADHIYALVNQTAKDAYSFDRYMVLLPEK